jgi:uncharacterized protein (DUF302 family)
MNYYLKATSPLNFKETLLKVCEELQKEGFGVLTEIDVKATLKKKLDVEFRNYQILGACNPPFALQALQAEPWIGLMLPCNVVVQETVDGRVEVGAIAPIVAMQSVNNPQLATIATEVTTRLERFIASF